MKLRGKLYPGEQTIVLTRAHPGALVGAFVYLLVAFTSASFASTARSSGLLFWAGSVVAAVTALVALRKIWRWSVTRYAITTHRIMIIKGLMRRKTDISLLLDGMGNRWVSQSSLGAWMGYGSFHVHYAGGFRHQLMHLPNPERFRNIVEHAWQDYYPLRVSYV